MRRVGPILIAIAVLVGARAVSQTTYHVAPGGSDSNPGTSDLPWASPGYGCTQMQSGDTLLIHGGTYHLSQYPDDILVPPTGASASWTTIRGEAGNRPVLVCGGDLAMAMDLAGEYIRVENIEITNDGGSPFRDGINGGMDSPLSHAVLDGLRVHHLDEFGLNMRDVSDLLIEDCEITHCGFGAVGGPAAVQGGWQNVVIRRSDLSYSGHYFQGGPGPNPSYDRPDGFGIEESPGPIEFNDTTAEHNLGDGLDSKADNTFIHECIVANNSCDGVKLWGTGSRVENTLIYGTGDGVGGSSPWAGLVIGTTDTNASFEIVNVTLHDNPTREAYSLYAQYENTNIPISVTFRNTIVANAFGAAYFGPSVTLTADHNLFHRPGDQIQVEANSRVYTVDQLGELGAGNLHGDPQFVAPACGTDGDYHLQTGSPALNSGTATDAPAGDLVGTSRPQGAGIDMGAYEMPDPTAASLQGISQW